MTVATGQAAVAGAVNFQDGLPGGEEGTVWGCTHDSVQAQVSCQARNQGSSSSSQTHGAPLLSTIGFMLPDSSTPPGWTGWQQHTCRAGVSREWFNPWNKGQIKGVVQLMLSRQALPRAACQAPPRRTKQAKRDAEEEL
jgi:hypothetical protein